ncbi:hypothetical protein [uncultured Polaribacter sp.]|uniref:hypothetical protein n=1 Tax=uncultured Polaribacter sp. TaxID=174711 RepID=UPI00261C9100|nr:hypothetical protein [uncultured Polaribacter sp.]
MKIKMLPNWCKKLGVSLFFIGLIIVFTSVSTRESFCEGYNSANNKNFTQDLEPVFIEEWLGKSAIHYFEVIATLGLLIYMMAKEKVEDDYINILRLESYQLTILIGLFITFIIYIISGNKSLKLDYYINLFMIFYLIIFAIKKRIY